LDALVDVEKKLAAAQALRLQILARFGELRPANRPGVTFADGAREEVSVEIGISPSAALSQIAQAEDLVTRLPGTVDALAAGEIDFRRAVAMSECTDVLSVEDAGRVERRVLAYGRRANPSKFRDSIRHHVNKVDPGAAERRRQEAKKHRDVVHYVGEDGMGQVTANLTAEQAKMAHDRIDKVARRVKDPERTLAQCRADVFLDLVMGKKYDQVPVQVNVTIPATTLLGLNQEPGILSGYGPITAEHARELAEHAVWRRVLTDPAGQVVESSRKRYASAGLREFIRLRDRTCRLPGCNTPAERCEVDHSIRHADLGVNSRENTAALCKYHNLMRERSGWDLEQPVQGTLVFTSPEGRKYVTVPEAYIEPESAPF
jgi:hypothetical protein